MISMTSDNLKTAYKSDATGSYLILTLYGPKSDISGYHTEMILNNRIRGILPFSIVRKNESVLLQYNITSLTRIMDFLDTGCREKDVLLILSRICDAMLESRGFLLDEAHFLLHTEFIYVNPATLEVHLVYLPHRMSTDVNKSFRELISAIIEKVSGTNEPELNRCCKRVLEFAKTDSLNVSGFREFIKELMEPDPTPFNEIMGENENHVSPFNTQAVLSEFDCFQKPLKESDKKNVCSFVFLVSLWNKAVRIFCKPKSCNNIKSVPEKPEPVNAGMRADTEILAEKKIPEPYLILKKGCHCENISIGTDCFLIGRLAEKVDYALENMAVGKIHACIKKRHGKFYIIDLNSKNGTFLNGVRLGSNIEYEIKDKDEIILANTEFTFMLN